MVKSVCILLASFAGCAWAAYAADFCLRDDRVEADDTSAPVIQIYLEEMKAIGINTIIRYYDHEDETLPGKTLRRGERDIVSKDNFKMGVVFQHKNNKFASFTARRGGQDA